MFSSIDSIKGVKLLSRVQLFATPWTVAHQAPLSMGSSRQEYWSGLPFPSPGIFPTQGLNLGLLHCRQTPYPLSHQGSILGHKTSLSKFKRIEIISRIFSDYSFMKLESNHRKKNRKRMNTWRLNNILLKTNG